LEHTDENEGPATHFGLPQNGIYLMKDCNKLDTKEKLIIPRIKTRAELCGVLTLLDGVSVSGAAIKPAN
jgi:hypothetical protein